MKTPVLVQSAALTKESKIRTLGEGSSVYVKILKNLGGGRYAASFGGNRFEISSAIKLDEGQGVLAKIKIEEKRILLVIQGEKSVQTAVLKNVEGVFDRDGKILNPQLAKYLERLGLFPDRVNYALLQTVKFLGMKFNPVLFARARRMARSFGSAEAASKTAMILFQKGMEPSEENIRRILLCAKDSDAGKRSGSEEFLKDESFEDGFFSEKEFDSEDGFDSERGGDSEPRGFSDSGGESYFYGRLEKDFFNALAENFKDLIEGKCKNPRGVLTLFNHSGFRYDSGAFGGSWVKIPIAFDFVSDGKKHSAGGEVCFFINAKCGKAEKCSVKAVFFEKLYRFVVLLNESPNRVLLGENFNVSEMKKIFPEFEFSLRSDDDLDFFPPDEDFLSVDGRV